MYQIKTAPQNDIVTAKQTVQDLKNKPACNLNYLWGEEALLFILNSPAFYNLVEKYTCILSILDIIISGKRKQGTIKYSQDYSPLVRALR